MPAQTMNDPMADTATVGDVTSRATSLAHDLITLAELQTRLLFLDLKEAGTRSAASAVSLAAMVALILSGGPIILFGFAQMLNANTDWPPGVANLVVGGVACLIGAIAAWVSVTRLQRVTRVLSRSQQELHQNLEFVKSLVSSPTESRTSRFSSMN